MTTQKPVETAASAIKRRRSEAASLVSPASTGPLSSTSRASSASSLSADVEAEHRSAARRRLFQLYASFAALLPPVS
ncbi:hypothetical protein HF086_013272 [Spodoptera exigua]|uniref:Uncharacterized protein n=1 Tax=Spodoptera exigua TaxID=7107 RepID=A0A922M263_SPOEX|nr:hypothetical protein HF086_013272 [Spodoptera exigua]